MATAQHPDSHPDPDNYPDPATRTEPSDTQDQPSPTERPRRAEGVQPDKPGSGDEIESQDPGIDPEKQTEKAQEQAHTALDNVREGYN